VSSPHRSRPAAPVEDEGSLLDAIAAGELDDHLGALAGAVEARRQLLLTVRSATALATLCVGDVVRITEQVSPRYLVGLHGKVVGLDDHAATVRLEHPSAASRAGASAARRSRSRSCRRLVESALAGRDADALGDRLDARGNPQPLGLLGVLARELGEL
jgi:hypothetical protein